MGLRLRRSNRYRNNRFNSNRFNGKRCSSPPQVLNPAEASSP